MITIIMMNIITGTIIILLGRHIGERGGQKIIGRTIWINILIIGYYIKKILIEGEERRIRIGDWIREINREIGYSIIIDKKTVIMVSLILIIGYIVIYYSYWYIEKEIVFKGYLLLFQVTMIVLVSSKTLLGVYIGWEWVGIMSYILISYWYRNITNVKSGIKAILYNKIGDIGFILILNHMLYNNTEPTYNVLSYTYTNTTYLDNLFYNILPIYILIASIAKSAQYIMHPWLGDAMAGPTPVSALLHAATMVTAGIVLLNRTVLYASNIWNYILIIGIITVLFGGIAGIGQNDIKKIIAYSTCSQLGYMYLISVYPNIPTEVSLYHLYMHGFFKALLFLAAGIIIHNNSNEQDIRRLNLKIKNNPYSYLFLLFGSLSLISIPYTSGYYSKETVIYSISNTEIFLLAILGAIFTTIYSVKLLYYTYYLKSTSGISTHEHIDKKYLYVLSILVSGSLYLGYYTYNIFIGEIVESIDSIRGMTSVPIYAVIITIISYLVIRNVRIVGWRNTLIYRYIYDLINRRTYIDPILNNLGDKFIQYSYHNLYLNLDKGILELFGPLGLYRSLFTTNLPIYNYSLFNLIPSLFIILLTLCCAGLFL